MNSQLSSSDFKQCGLSYVEVLIAVVLLGVSLVPAMEALTTGIQASGVNESHITQHFYLQAKFEEVLAQKFSYLKTEAKAVASPTVATAYSDSPGSADRRLVYLSLYDGDNKDADNDPFTGMDQNLIWVRATIENSNHVFESLTAKH